MGNSINSDYNKTAKPENLPFKTDYKLASFFARVNYTFEDKYDLTFTLRDDGTSKFGPNTVLAFSAAAFSWKIMNEGFMKESRWFPNLNYVLVTVPPVSRI